MPDLNQEMSLWYGGNTYACVSFDKNFPTQWCGQIVPPSDEALYHLKEGGLWACVRTEQESIHISCNYVQKLYTPNFIVDNWGWLAVAVVIAYIAYKAHFKKQAPKAS